MVIHKRSVLTARFKNTMNTGVVRLVEVPTIIQLCGAKAKHEGSKPPALSKNWDDVTCSRCLAMRSQVERIRM